MVLAALVVTAMVVYSRLIVVVVVVKNPSKSIPSLSAAAMSMFEIKFMLFVGWPS